MRILCLTILLLIMASFSNAQSKKNASRIAITGEVIDSKCYMAQGDSARGEKHKKCAIECAKNGIPLAILEDKTDNVYFVSMARRMSSANDMLMPFVAEKVNVTGNLVERGGAKMLFIESIERKQ